MENELAGVWTFRFFYGIQYLLSYFLFGVHKDAGAAPSICPFSVQCAAAQVTIRALHRPVSCRVWRKLACSSKAKRLKLFKEREFLQQDPVGSQDVYVGIYKFREQW